MIHTYPLLIHFWDLARHMLMAYLTDSLHIPGVS
jgi:hypothetical protein